mgnify:FL=1
MLFRSDGQKKLLASNILVIGAGGLGSSAIYYLAANGVGNITVIDNDEVELSNLQRQIIHNNSDIGEAKVYSAKKKINLLNDDVIISPIKMRIDYEYLKKIVNNFDYILDCSDNFNTRFAINKACYENSMNLISAAVKEFYGQLAFFNFSKKSQPCYSCFNHNDIKKDFDLPISEKGILGSIPGILGSMQATLTINQILNIGQDMSAKMMICDLLNFNFRQVKLNKNRSCKICSR